MKLSVRIFIAYFFLVAIAMWWYVARTIDELKPAYLQPSEEVMVDTANLLAEIAAPSLLQVLPNSLDNSELANAINRYRQRELAARIWSYEKNDPDLIVYVTDAYGTVLYHTDPLEIGVDYHDWLDVSRTLQGDYGARTSESVPGQVSTRVAYVAAPIKVGGEIVGVLTVGKPHASLQPLLDSTRHQVLINGAILLLLALASGGLLAWWLTSSIRKLTRYARQVRDGERVQAPHLAEKELSYLAEAMSDMRNELRSASYIERYVYSVTHEMKSPIAAIRGAAELMHEADMPAEERYRFIANIQQEAERMQSLIDHLLELAKLEKREQLQQPELLDLRELIQKVLLSVKPVADRKNVAVLLDLPEQLVPVYGEAFLLQLALGNLLENAVQFSVETGTVTIAVTTPEDQSSHSIRIINQGVQIPEYAEARLFERFYSLPRPDGSPKSTGLGLSIVREIAKLHGGSVSLSNSQDKQSVIAELGLPSGIEIRDTMVGTE